MTNLTELITRWIGEEEECDEGDWCHCGIHPRNWFKQDLKSRIPDLERQIRAELLREQQSDKSIGDVLAALRDGNDTQ